jgi:hypothetical protein
MTVRVRPSANRTYGWPTAVPAALLLAVMITGCGNSGGAASVAASGSRDPGKSASPSACSSWAGLDDLFNVTTWLRQLIGDEVIFGASTQQARRDGLAVIVYAESLDGLWETLPPQYARSLRDSVLSVATSPYKETPEQLNTAANDAQSLAARISRLCF